MGPGGANERARYAAEPNLLPLGVELANLIINGTNGELQDRDVIRLQSFDLNDAQTFATTGEILNLHNGGLFKRFY